MTRNEQIIAMREQGVGPREIARRIGVSNGVVSGVLFRAGRTEATPVTLAIGRAQPVDDKRQFNGAKPLSGSLALEGVWQRDRARLAYEDAAAVFGVGSHTFRHWLEDE